MEFLEILDEKKLLNIDIKKRMVENLVGIRLLLIREIHNILKRNIVSNSIWDIELDDIKCDFIEITRKINFLNR